MQLLDFLIKLSICIGFSYIISSISIKLFLAFIKNKSLCNQPIRESGPQSHIIEKKNTPTFGGIFIILATILTSFLFIDSKNCYYLVFILIFSIFGLIGFIDDYIKVFYKNSNGFKGSIKIIIQFLTIAIAYVWLGQIDSIHNNARIFFPINNGFSIGIGTFLHIIFFAFVIVGTSNAVNLTDGLDGLVSVPVIINLICLIILIFIASDINLAKKFKITHIPNSKELIFFCAALIGGIIGFLQFNLKPAKIFMGDVGSLAIGSVLGLTAIIIKQEFIFFIISLLFVAEALSVILQVGSYKLRKKRIFLMAPLHHHFEKKGLSEIQVVKRFWTFSLLFAIIGISIILI